MSPTTIADVELGLAIALCTAFIGLFVWRSKWRTRAGLFLLGFAGVIDVLMSLRMFSRVVWPLGDGFWAVGFAALDGVFLWLLWLLWRVERPAIVRVGGWAMSTQVRHPWRATVRTGFAVAVALASLLPVVLVAGGLDTAPAAGQVLAVAAAITRVMALPGVDEFLRRFVPWLAPDSPPPPPNEPSGW